MTNNITCNIIAVDCVHNDPVDIRCGGPLYLGFEFFVKKEETDEMIEYIISELVENGIPYMNIYKTIQVEREPEGVWTKERIHNCILREKDYIISESKRSYNRR